MLTVRSRLTLGVLSLVSVLFLALVGFEYYQLRGFLTDSEAVRLRAQAKPLVDIAAGTGFDGDLAGRLATDLTSADTGALVLDPTGAVIGRPRAATIGAPPPADVPAGAVAAAVAGELEVDVVRDTGAGRELLALVPEPGAAPPRAVVVLSTSLTDEDSLARSQLFTGLIALVVGLTFAGVATLVLVRRTLRPLRRIAESAGRVAAGDLTQRVRLSEQRDEIGSLAASFDAMTEALQRGFADLERSERRSREFVADASHELRTPLTTLAGFTDVLLRRSTERDREAARLLASLRREVDRMQRIVDDLLLLARADSDLDTTREPVDLRAAAVRVVEQLRPVAGGRTLTVAGRPATAWSDPDRLHQVLLNLADNAVRHTASAGSVLVTVAERGEQVTVTVADDGDGMDETTRQVAFERFSRGGRRRGAGAGLGLAIVAALVHALDGEVELDSAPEVGTAVRVTLPSAVRKTTGT